MMGSGKQPQDRQSPSSKAEATTKSGEHAQQPEWADGLRKMYDSVVDEPLPDSFKDLLAKLDETDESEQN